MSGTSFGSREIRALTWGWWLALLIGALSIVAGIIVARNLERADDLFGGPQGSPRTDTMIAAAVQWAERIMKKVDSVYVVTRFPPARAKRVRLITGCSKPI